MSTFFDLDQFIQFLAEVTFALLRLVEAILEVIDFGLQALIAWIASARCGNLFRKMSNLRSIRTAGGSNTTRLLGGS